MERQFWHIQLHSDKKLPEQVLRTILEEKSVIGMAASWTNKRGEAVKDPKQFRDKMKIGDAVLVRNGRRPIALVEIAGDAFITADIDPESDWFPLRRKVKVLGFYDKKAEKILNDSLSKYGKKQIQTLGTLTLCSRPTATKDFIWSWWKYVYHKSF